EFFRVGTKSGPAERDRVLRNMGVTPPGYREGAPGAAADGRLRAAPRGFKIVVSSSDRRSGGRRDGRRVTRPSRIATPSNEGARDRGNSHGQVAAADASPAPGRLPARGRVPGTGGRPTGVEGAPAPGAGPARPRGVLHDRGTRAARPGRPADVGVRRPRGNANPGAAELAGGG